jgi:biopolymer transport protein ExbD
MKIKLGQSNQLLSAFSYSSLTDIVMLLLIFFLLTSSFIATKGLKVHLPQAKNVAVSEQRNVTISLLKDGRLLVNDVEVPAEKLRETLRAQVSEPDKQVLILSSDRDVPLSRAVFVMDEAKSIGASRFFISTAPKEAAHDARP